MGLSKGFFMAIASIKVIRGYIKKEFCHFYVSHRRDAEPAEVFYKEIFSLRSLRLCGQL